MRQYRLEPLRLRLFYTIAAVVAIIGLVLTAFFAWVVGTHGFDVIGLIVIAAPLILCGAIALSIGAAARAVRLKLTDAGITLYLPGARLSTTWDNVESISVAPWGPLTGEALRLRNPAQVRGWWFSVLADPGYASAIPLSPFALPLAGSRLEADLRSRLPQLFTP